MLKYKIPQVVTLPPPKKNNELRGVEKKSGES